MDKGTTLGGTRNSNSGFLMKVKVTRIFLVQLEYREKEIEVGKKKYLTNSNNRMKAIVPT